MKLTELAARVDQLHNEWLASQQANPDTRDQIIRAAAELAELTLQCATVMRQELVQLRYQFAQIHVIGVDDTPTAADYRDHGEHNADVREAIQDSARSLAGQLDIWLGEPSPTPSDD